MIIDLHRLEVFSLCIRISFKVVFKTIFLNFFQKFSYSRLQINCEILESKKIKNNPKNKCQNHCSSINIKILLYHPTIKALLDCLNFDANYSLVFKEEKIILDLTTEFSP